MKFLYYIKMLLMVNKFQALPENTYNAHHLFIIEINNRKDLYEF